MFEGLILSAALQFGIMNGAAYCMKPNDVVEFVECPPLYATLSVDARCGIFFANASVRTDMWMMSLTNYDPYDLSFQIGGGISIGPLVFGICHTCYHPMTTYSIQAGYRIVPYSEGATDDLYIRLNIGGGQ